MFKALLRTPKEAAGAKAAAEPIKRDVTVSFILVSSGADYGFFEW